MNSLNPNQVNQGAPLPAHPVLPELPPQHDIGRFIGQSWDIYQHMFPKFMQIYLKFFIKLLILFIPVVLVGAYFYATNQSTITLEGLNETELVLGLLLLAAFAIYVVALVFLALWWQLSLLHAVRTRNNEVELTVNELIALSRPQVRGFFWTGAVTGIVTVLWALLFIIPGIIFGVYYALTDFVYADTGKSGLAALRLSKAYITGYWWKTVYSLLGLAAVTVLVYIATAVASSLAGEGVGSLVSGVVNIIFVPYSVVYMCLLYERFKQIKPELQPTSVQ